MKKFKLNIDDLRLESFEPIGQPGSAAGGDGTVVGYTLSQCQFSECQPECLNTNTCGPTAHYTNCQVPCEAMTEQFWFTCAPSDPNCGENCYCGAGGTEPYTCFCW